MLVTVVWWNSSGRRFIITFLFVFGCSIAFPGRKFLSLHRFFLSSWFLGNVRIFFDSFLIQEKLEKYFKK